MNNDFNYKPPQKPRQEEGAFPAVEPAPVEDTAPVEQPEQEQATPNSPVITSDRPKKGHGLLVFLVMLLLLLVAAAGVYYWQHQKVQSLSSSKTSLTSQVASLQSQLAKKNAATNNMGSMPASSMNSTAATPDVNVITGNADTITATTANATVEYIPNKATEVWIESGTSPDKLTVSTPHQKVSTEGMQAMYMGQVFKLTGLKASTQYFYRAAGMVSGKTVEAGIVSFTTTK